MGAIRCPKTWLTLFEIHTICISSTEVFTPLYSASFWRDINILLHFSIFLSIETLDGAGQTPCVYHCHSTHIWFWIWPSDGPHAYFSNKQTDVSTGEKTYDMTVYKVWKHAAWSKHAVKSWLYVEYPAGWMLFAWRFFNHHSDTEKRLSTTTMRWLGKPQQKTNLLSVSIHSTILYH